VCYISHIPTQRLCAIHRTFIEFCSLVFFCLQPKINIPDFLSASDITDLMYASDSKLELDEDERDNADLSLSRFKQ
jgi:hypothetical protein